MYFHPSVLEEEEDGEGFIYLRSGLSIFRCSQAC